MGGFLVYLVWTIADIEAGEAGHESTQHIMLKITAALATLLTTGVPQGLIIQESCKAASGPRAGAAPGTSGARRERLTPGPPPCSASTPRSCGSS